MDFIEDIWVSQERAQTGFRAEVDRPAAIFDAWKIGWIRVAEFSSTEGDKRWVLPLFWGMFRHSKNHNIHAAVPEGCFAKDGGLSIE